MQMEALIGWLAKTTIRCLACLPLPVSRGIGAAIGRYNAWANTRMARVTDVNLRLCLPELDAGARHSLVKRSLIETGKAFTETGAVWLRPYPWLRARILAVHRQELLEQGIAGGKGVLILAPHIGNWEVLGLYLSELTQVTSLYQPPDLPALENLIRRAREKAGATLVPTNRKGVAALLKALRNGEIAAILPDQVPDLGSGAFAPFFGQPALTMTLVRNLIDRTDCRVVVSYAKRVSGGFEIFHRDADADIYSKDENLALAAMNKCVEFCVREVPEQYQWEYKRFKRRPQGEEKLYRY